jgi:GT2 family glycosyltransferase/SAM-dependent methyltransferase/glycosyltransferase involved in cell wall biosynthesis
VPWSPDIQVIYEHYHRYAFARDLCRGKRVLDLACGEGYGTALLATKAASVVGVDIDDLSIEHARRTYQSDNIEFYVGSMTNVALLSDVPEFDVVVCFEAIEHVDEHDAVMKLIRARLADGGVLLMSTPDTTEYAAHDDNPFHVHELSLDAFGQLLSESFDHHHVLCQQVTTGSTIVDLGESDRADGEHRGFAAYTLQQQGDGWELAAGVPHTYLLGIASDRPVESLVTNSVLLDPDLTLARDADMQAQRDILQRLYDDSRQEVADLKHALERGNEHSLRLQGDFDRLAAALADADERAAIADQQAAAANQRAAAADQWAAASAEETARISDLLRAEQRTADALDASLTWLRQSATNSGRRAHAAELEVRQLQQELRAMSPMVQRGLTRYRGVVERAAPRGTRRRDVYEVALGRPSGVLPEPRTELPPPRLPLSSDPQVSIIIPVHGQWAFTDACLRSIAAAMVSVPYEVLVIDDASMDETAAELAECRGIRVVSLEENVGFVRACNEGAAAARADLLFFLNNDAQIMSGSIEQLVETMSRDDTVGMVGSKLVYPDGRLQEAGGIIWADGTGWNYGRGDDPGDAAANVVRDVDYVSGAALLVRKDIFDEVGGFDERYSPAYYEDVDLAFAVRNKGYRVVVQPNSVVVHHEGISHGVDVNTGLKRYQELNREQFCEKWRQELTQQLPKLVPDNLWLARQRSSSGGACALVLVADHQVPSCDTDAGSVRMFEILRHLSMQDVQVVFLPANGGRPPRETEALQQLGVTVLCGWEEQARFMREAGSRISFALLSRPQVAVHYLENVRRYAPNAVVAYDTVDLHFVRIERQAATADAQGHGTEAIALRRVAHASRELELSLARSCDVTLVVSDVERELLAQSLPGADVRVLSLIRDISSAPEVADDRRTVLFVGSFDHPPNQDAARWLATEIMPLVRGEIPDALLQIVGSHPKPEILQLAGPGVEVHGDVPDLAPYFRRARVMAAPLRFGAGVKGKIVESVAQGVPVVTTSVGVEGIPLLPDRDVLVGDSCDELAQRVVRLLRDDTLWCGMSASAKESVRAHFSRERACEVLDGLLAIPATAAVV